MIDRRAYHNLVEEGELVRLFTAFPPLGFACRISGAGAPLFVTDYDLLTTLEKDVLAAVRALPLRRVWGRLLKVSACFCGTTATEYAPLPAGPPEAFLDALREEYASRQSLLIIKDLPLSSPLLPAADNALTQNLVNAARARGFWEVMGQALAYVPIDFSGEAEYLSRLSAARRKDMRRKLRQRERLAVSVLPLGDAALCEPGFLAEAYAMYMEVFRQSDIHFDCLRRDYFAALFSSQALKGAVFLYRHEGELAAYNICLEHKGMLIDKYIGFKYPLARELNLYFISWMVNLEYARQQGHSMYIAGWTDPEVKASLGAKFTFTRHLVWVDNPVLRALLRPLRGFFEADAKCLEALS